MRQSLCARFAGDMYSIKDFLCRLDLHSDGLAITKKIGSCFICPDRRASCLPCF